MNALISPDEARSLIAQGRPMLLAGTEALLRDLPRGPWVGGTIPYFMGPEGGVTTHDRLFVTQIPLPITSAELRSYGEAELPEIARRSREGLASFILLPGFSAVHRRYAHDCQSWPGLFERPVVGWVTGFDLDEPGRPAAKVVDGTTGEVHGDRAMVMHLPAVAGWVARVGISNIFTPGGPEQIRFPRGGFEVKRCLVDGVEHDFARWLAQRRVDTRLPLVADYSGALINVSMRAVDPEAGKVSFYAPVFPEMTYRLAAPVQDHAVQLQLLAETTASPTFACNCVLNYLHGNLKGRRTGNVQGPITFGEIAYLVLNQTAVYLTFEQA
jgi:uncharacterized protein DUF6976